MVLSRYNACVLGPALLLLAPSIATAPPALPETAAIGLIVDDGGCVVPDELERDLEALLPSEIQRDKLVVEVQGAKQEAGHALELRVRLSRGEAPFLTRAIDLGPDECAEAARLLARIVARQVARLDDEDLRWLEEPEAPKPPPPPEAPPPAPPAPVPPTTPPIEWRVQPLVGVTAGAGLLPPLGFLSLGGLVGVGAGVFPDLLVGASVGFTPTVPVGAGAAQLVLPMAHLGVGYSVDVFGLGEISPRAIVSGGLTTAWGVGFDEPELAVLPTASGSVSVAYISPWGPFAEVGAEIPFTRIHLVETGGPGEFDAWLIGPWARVGFRWDLRF